MLTWIKRKIVQWVREDIAREEAEKAEQEESEGRGARRGLRLGDLLGDGTNSTYHTDAKFRVSLVPAVNGRLLEISTYSPNPHGPDWSHELYVVEEGEKLSSAIGKVMIMKGLES
jgi:hypothetical protein